MVSEEIRNAIPPWRFFTACPLLAAVLICSAESADAADAGTPNTEWDYRSYLRYSAAVAPASFNSVAIATQISVATLLRQRGADPGDQRLILSASFDDNTAWESLRYGVGLCANLPEAGQVHFNLYVRPNATRPGLRWQLQPAGLPIITDDSRPTWSIGGFVDYSRSHDEAGQHNHNRLGIAPQLILNLGPLLHVPGDAQASFQYAYWRSEAQADAALPQSRAMQMALRWRF